MSCVLKICIYATASQLFENSGEQGVKGISSVIPFPYSAVWIVSKDKEIAHSTYLFETGCFTQFYRATHEQSECILLSLSLF